MQVILSLEQLSLNDAPEPKQEPQTRERQVFIDETAERILDRLHNEAQGLPHAHSLFKSYLTQMCDEYDRRKLAGEGD